MSVPAPDPYAATDDSWNDLNETRPLSGGGALRRGRAGAIIVGLVLFAVAAIVWNSLEGKRPISTASDQLYTGVNGIPAAGAQPPASEPQPEPEKKVETPAPKKAAPKPPPKRKSALGSKKSTFPDPSQSYAEREVNSWNPRTNREQSVAK